MISREWGLHWKLQRGGRDDMHADCFVQVWQKWLRFLAKSKWQVSQWSAEYQSLGSNDASYRLQGGGKRQIWVATDTGCLLGSLRLCHLALRSASSHPARQGAIQRITRLGALLASYGQGRCIEPFALPLLATRSCRQNGSAMVVGFAL